MTSWSGESNRKEGSIVCRQCRTPVLLPVHDDGGIQGFNSRVPLRLYELLEPMLPVCFPLWILLLYEPVCEANQSRLGPCRQRTHADHGHFIQHTQAGTTFTQKGSHARMRNIKRRIMTAIDILKPAFFGIVNGQK